MRYRSATCTACGRQILIPVTTTRGHEPETCASCLSHLVAVFTDDRETVNAIVCAGARVFERGTR